MVQRPVRHIVVFVDRLFLPELDPRTRVFVALKEFLARSLGPHDEAMIVTWGDSVRIVRSFTGDLEELDRTLDTVARRSARLDAQATELDPLVEQDVLVSVRREAGWRLDFRRWRRGPLPHPRGDPGVGRFVLVGRRKG